MNINFNILRKCQNASKSQSRVSSTDKCTCVCSPTARNKHGVDVQAEQRVQTLVPGLLLVLRE